MDQVELKARTKRFGLDVIKFVQILPRNETSFVIRRQLLRSATSVGANYRAACRGRSKAEFIAKLGISIGRRTKASTGWKCCWKLRSYPLNKQPCCSTRLTKLPPSSQLPTKLRQAI
ncbi:MAG: four helix bundle protein [Anaerolineales bacterium]|nr:four helix bundle protein [Anaerolineales bacterium]MCW5855746.1 four helix bundle protein [Anaerolineales bacterium]